MKTKKIYCCECVAEVDARLTNGQEIYPNWKPTKNLPFWKCDHCDNYVGCHHKSHNRTKPLGIIPTKELRKARVRIHELIDPAWKYGSITRDSIYKHLSEMLGRPYHTAEIKTLDEANAIYNMANHFINKQRSHHNGTMWDELTKIAQ